MSSASVAAAETDGATATPQTRSINNHREGVGAPLVLIHGIGLRWQIWRPVIGRLGRTSL
jgi:hypothetical protein